MIIHIKHGYQKHAYNIFLPPPLSLGKLDCLLDVTLRTATGGFFLNPSFFQIQYWRPLIFCKIHYWAEKNPFKPDPYKPDYVYLVQSSKTSVQKVQVV